VQLAARLCNVAEGGEIVVSVAVRELSIGKPFKFEDRGRVAIKGISEPPQVYAVAWNA
jgi:class 3 adenylate cyclase